jgi:hydrogenase expression/formation protein HypC
MCLGIPGQVVEMTDPAGYLAKVDVNGIKRVISVRLLADPGLQSEGGRGSFPAAPGIGLDVGDWVLVHVGFAMARIDEREARQTIEAVRRMGQAYADELDAFKSSTAL